MRKILLDSVKSKLSVNNDKGIPVQLSRDSGLLNEELLATTVDTMGVYNEEKDQSSKHRLIFTIYPLCSNVLFNMITEVVYREGSEDAKLLMNANSNGVPTIEAISKEPLNRVQAIRNTEYSNNVFDLTYHCGADIFNNRTFRGKEDVCIQKKKTARKANVTGDTKITTDTFNTIGDYSRNSEGDYIKIIYPSRSKNYTYATKFEGYEQVYHYDTVKSFKQTYNDSLQRKEGWIGFSNPSSMHIPSTVNDKKDYYINKCINSKKPCEFIHLSPEKELFSFTPIRNPHRNRLEQNWDYFITYPASSDSRGLEKGLPLGRFNVINTNNNIIYKQYKGENGVEYLMFYSPIPHNLKVNDYVYIYLGLDDYRMKCKVKKLGDFNGKKKENYFTILKDDLKDQTNGSDELYPATPMSFVKVSNGYECKYYYRKFRKIEGLKSSISRLAFAGTVYGDDVTQIVFTDDIDVKGLKDNLGRDLTEIYLTILKSNRGHEEWYKANVVNSDKVEYSHVFGEVSSGFDLPYDFKPETSNLFIVRQQHNVDNERLPNEVEVPASAPKLESNITRDMDEFMGDLVEFDPGRLEETVLTSVMHRFNTAQRETLNSEYKKIYYDDVMMDGYDGNKYGTDQSNYYTSIVQNIINEGFANIDPEGYIYKPHHRIKIGEFDTQVKHLSDTLLHVSECALTDVDVTYLSPTGKVNVKGVSFKTKTGYGINAYDRLVLLDKTTYEPVQMIVISYTPVEDGYICNAIRMDEEDMQEASWNEKYYVYKHNPNIPDYAYLLPDGTGKYIWREKIANSAISFTSDLYDIPFTNGAFYHHSTVIFPVRRQDPFGEYNLYVKKDGARLDDNFKVPGVKEDVETDIYIEDNSNTLCL